MSAPTITLDSVPEMFYNGAGPALLKQPPAPERETSYEDARPMISNTQNPPVCQAPLRASRLEMGEALYNACCDGKMRWSDVQGTEVSGYGRATGFVYFATIGHPKPTHIKIGFTRGNPDKRIASLQTGCPFSIALIQIVAGTPEMERDLHGFLIPWRVSGEWFALEPRMKMMLANFWDEAA